MEYQLATWPRAIRIDQDAPRGNRVPIFDADTGKPLTAVLSLSVSRADSYVEMTMAAHEPVKPAILATVEEEEQYAIEQGILVERRRYRITSMQIQAEA